MRYRLSILCLVAIAMVVMIGALPTGAGSQEGGDVPVQVFSSPVFVLLLMGLCIACLACCRRAGISLRRTGFILTHIGVVVLLVGAMVSGVLERKVGVILPVGGEAATDRLAVSELKERLTLPFILSVPALEPIPEYFYHIPDKSARGGYRMAGRFIPDRGGIKLDEGKRVPLERLQPGGTWEQRIILETGAFLQLNRSAGMACRARLRIERERTQPLEINLEPGESESVHGTRIRLEGMEWRSKSEAVVKVRVRLEGRDAWESIYVAPGPQGRSHEHLLSHIALPFTLSAKSFQVEYYPPEYALHLPPDAMRGVDQRPSTHVPGPKGIELGDGLVVPVEQLHPAGEDWMEQIELGNGRVLKKRPPTAKHYQAEVVIEDQELGTREVSLAVNRPISLRGWRFYLMSYDSQHEKAQYLSLLARRDPGRWPVVVGIYMLLAGTFLLCLKRKGETHDG
ncbi:MAG: cytochrome c biogenesis protein ResB [Planctomycetota bacterium]|jgi:hypothetical protein